MQLVMGLLRPWSILLLDEVTVDLDVLVRSRLLAFLERETSSRDCAVVYASHIFDGLAEWPTNLIHIHMGRILECGKPADIIANTSLPKRATTLTYNSNSALLELALKWLSEDLKDRGRREDVKRLRWDEISKNDKDGGMNLSAFDAYFKFSRAR